VLQQRVLGAPLVLFHSDICDRAPCISAFFHLTVNPDIQFICTHSRLIKYAIMYIPYTCFLETSPNLNYYLELKVSNC
jgi:hypothetical protein